MIHYSKIGRCQLFDMANDPLEKEDLYSQPCHATVVGELRARLEAWQEEAGNPLLPEGR